MRVVQVLDVLVQVIEEKVVFGKIGFGFVLCFRIDPGLGVCEWTRQDFLFVAGLGIEVLMVKKEAELVFVFQLNVESKFKPLGESQEVQENVVF